MKQDIRSIVAINVKEHMQGQSEEQFRNRRGSWHQVKSFVKNRELLLERTGKFAKLERAKLLQHTMQSRHSMEHVPSFESQLKDEEVQELLDNKMADQKEPGDELLITTESNKDIEGKNGDDDDASSQNFVVPEICQMKEMLMPRKAPILLSHCYGKILLKMRAADLQIQT